MTCDHRWAKCQIILFLLCFVLPASSAQNLLSNSGGAELGTLGGVKSTHHGAVAMMGNVAGIARNESLSLYAGADLRFSNPDLKFLNLSAAIPSDLGAFGFVFQHHGFELYNEQMIGIGYARQLSEQVSFGAKFDYFQLRIPTYGKASYLAGELGVLSKIGRWVEVGFYVYHPFDRDLVENEILPNQFTFGVNYQPSTKLKVLAEMTKTSDYQENMRFGIEYYFIDKFAIRLGVATEPALLSFGVALRPDGNMSVSLGSTFQQGLGMSPLLGVGYEQ